MITLYNTQLPVLALKVLLSGGSSSRLLNIPSFGNRQITEAEYTQNPDYYNGFITKGQMSMQQGTGILFDVNDEPLNHQIGKAVAAA